MLVEGRLMLIMGREVRAQVLHPVIILVIILVIIDTTSPSQPQPIGVTKPGAGAFQYSQVKPYLTLHYTNLQ